MSIQPQGEDIRKAVKWVSEERRLFPDKTLKALVSEACTKFDLSPIDCEFLDRCLREDKG